MAMAPCLSSINTVGPGKVTVRLVSNFLSYTTSCVAKLCATYSASDVDNATTACFLLTKLIGPPAIKNNCQLLSGGHQSHQPSLHLSNQPMFHLIFGT